MLDRDGKRRSECGRRNGRKFEQSIRNRKEKKVVVPDRRSQILEVVIVRRLVTWVLGIWRGEGLGRVEKGEVSLQATWTDPVTARRVSK
jgi:hypothetical protein